MCDLKTAGELTREQSTCAKASIWLKTRRMMDKPKTDINYKTTPQTLIAQLKQRHFRNDESEEEECWEMEEERDSNYYKGKSKSIPFGKTTDSSWFRPCSSAVHN